MISVIIPMYNAHRTIIQTLTGLANQSIKNFEIIIVDDGSTDNSLSLIKEFVDKNHLNVKIIQEKNSGPAKARNLAAHLALLTKFSPYEGFKMNIFIVTPYLYNI